MKKKYYLGITLFIIGLFLIIGTYKILNQNISIKDTNQLWIIYDQNLESVKRNLDEIAVSEEEFVWSKLKSVSIEDQEYQNLLDTFVRSMGQWYYFYASNDEAVLNGMPIRKQRNEKGISKDLLKTLKENDWIVIDFRLIYSLYESKGLEIPERMKEKLEEVETILHAALYTKEDITYEDLVLRKVLESSILNNLSEWLKAEYYQYS